VKIQHSPFAVKKRRWEMPKAELSFGDALRLGSAAVPAPHGMEIERCGIGMVYKAHGVRSPDCGTINLIYSGVVDKVWPCPWCADKEEVQCHGLVGASVVRHPFSEHYLAGHISIEDLACWLDYISTDPNSKQLQGRIRTMPKFAAGTQVTRYIDPSAPERMTTFDGREPGPVAVAP
jgi:hypothetical protein